MTYAADIQSPSEQDLDANQPEEVPTGQAGGRFDMRLDELLKAERLVSV